MKKHLKWIIPLCAVAIIAIAAVIFNTFYIPAPVKYEPGMIIYQSKNVTATVVAPTPNRVEVMPYMRLPEPEEVFDGYPVIATGTVSNIREVEVSYTNNGSPTKKVITLFDFHVDKYVKNTSWSLGRKRFLTVGWPSSSYYYFREYPTLGEGEKFLLFMDVSADLDYEDILEREGYTDTWVTAPSVLAFERWVTRYTINQYFERYLTDEEKSRAETDLVDIIKQKIKEYS